jgi:hypothetical protein
MVTLFPAALWAKDTFVGFAKSGTDNRAHG